MERLVRLDDETERAVEDLAGAAGYGSADDVIRIAVRREKARHDRKARLHALRTAEFERLEPLLREGLADAQAGRVVELDDACARLTAKYQKMVTDRGH